MLFPIFAAVFLTHYSVFAIPLDERILEYGSNGTTVVLLAVATIEQSTVFPDDNGMLRRIAYVETRDGTTKPLEQNIWAVSQEALQQTQLSSPTLNVKHNLIALEFEIDWKAVQWNDLMSPFYSALAARLLLFIAPERLPDSSDIAGQAQYWKQYYNRNGSISDFTGAAYELEGNVLESTSSTFFIGFGINSGFSSSKRLQLFISSTEPDPVLVKIESLRGFNFTGIAFNNATLTVDIPTTFEVRSREDRDNGLRVSAGNSNIVVYGLSYEIFTSDAFLALPCDRLPVESYEYYGVSYNRGSHILIVGCEDNTEIQINSYVIELNKMETFLWETGNNITGMKVVSNRPIVVYTGHRCTNIPTSSSACDHITEQVPPTAIWGSNFMTASYAGRSSGDLYRILASDNSTNVTVNCSTVSETYTLASSGSWQEFSTPDMSFCSISSDKPLLVMQFSLGNSFDNVGDPFMMMITPVEQYSNNYIINVLPEFEANYITLYVRPEDFEPLDIIVDDNDLKNATWTTVYCSDTSTICGYITYVTLNPGEHQLYHRDVSAHIGVSAYGFNSYNSYGYPGGLRLVPIQLATISFSKSNYKVIENEGVVKINLLRSGNTSTEAVVLIGTHPYRGSATAERDYVPVIEIVTFLSEEVIKTVEILITNDRNIEFDETFFLYLTSGEGVHLSPFSTAEVIIRNDDGQIFLKPRYGSELGGTPVVVTGTNLIVADKDSVTCVFSHRETEGFVINEREVLCISPEMTKTGRIPFELRIDGEQSSITGSGVFIFLVHNKASDVTLENQDPFISSGTILKLRWSPKCVLPVESADSYAVDIILREYNITSREWVFTDLAKDIPNTGYVEVVTPDFVSTKNYDDSFTSAIIQIGVSESNIVAQNRTHGLFSKSLRAIAKHTVIIYVVKVVLVDPLLRQYCEDWASSQSREDALQTLAELPACPCTESEMRQERETFETDSGVLKAILRQYFHPGSCSCFRQRNMPRFDPGQQCCYDCSGNIIVGPPGGGSVDNIAPIDAETTNEHFWEDVVPFIACCKAEFLNNCEQYYEFRPSDNCSRTRPPPPAFARGDPHLVTLDGLQYTFNGRGEYTLIETTDSLFTLQGRMIQASGTNGSAVAASVFSAIAGKDHNSDTVQFEIDQHNTLTAIVSGELVVFDISEQEFENVTVTNLGNNSIEALFDSGVYLQAKGENGFISFLQVFLPDKFTNNVNGLLGDFNGNISDDLVPQFGDTPLPPDTSAEDIHKLFGITWIVDSTRKSLFYYQPEESWDTFYDPYFVPSYQPNFNNPELESQAKEICGEDKFCLFDIATTGSVDVGIATHESSKLIEEIYSFSIPVVCDPPCDYGACIASNTCKCSQGYTGKACTEIVVCDPPCDYGACIANNTCKCSQGYTGKACTEIVLQACEENICDNGGTCSKHVNDYRCECPPGFSGFLCEEGDSTKDDSTVAIAVGTVFAMLFIILCSFIVFGVVLRCAHQRRYKVNKTAKENLPLSTMSDK